MEVTEAAERYLDQDDDPEVYRTLSQASDKNGRDFFLLHTCLRQTLYLSMVPDLLKRIIKNKTWKQWKWIDREFHAETLTDYLTKHPPKGLGVALSMVEKLVEDDPEALALFRENTTGEKHVRKNGDTDIVSIKPEHGNSKAYTLDRLKRDEPELFAKVVAKELSANAAAIQAGWRKPPASPLQKLRSAWKAATAEERETFLKEIQ